jgi:hypothetical protein
MLNDNVTHLVPESSRHLRMYASIAEDNEAAVFNGDQEQDPIAKLCVAHPQSVESPMSGCHRVLPGFSFNANSYLARRPRFCLTYGLQDCFLIGWTKETL